MKTRITTLAASAGLAAVLAACTATPAAAAVTNASTSRTSITVYDDGRAIVVPPNRKYAGSAERVCFQTPRPGWDNTIWRYGVPWPVGRGCVSVPAHALSIAIQN